MPANIKDVLQNIKTIYMTDSSLETLLDYERVLDEMDLYAFDHWKLGELVEGPVYEKYFVTFTVKSPDDFKPGTKVPKMVSKPVWLVSITIPKKLMSDIQQGSIELENETLDTEDIETAYEQGLDDETDVNAGEEQNAQQQAQPAPAI